MSRLISLRRQKELLVQILKKLGEMFSVCDRDIEDIFELTKMIDEFERDEDCE